MAKYYHVNETDEIISEDQLRAQYEAWKADGTIDPHEAGYEDFARYLELCMWYNDGELTPLRKYYQQIKARWYLEDDPEEKDSLGQYLEKLRAYESEV